MSRTAAPDWQLAPHGTAAAARRHYRRNTPLCDACRQWESRRRASDYARALATGTITRAVHASSGGRPRCGLGRTNTAVTETGEDITCVRCLMLRTEARAS